MPDHSVLIEIIQKTVEKVVSDKIILFGSRAGKSSKEILYEDLCFDAQQPTEKCLKALLIKLNKPFPKTHSTGLILKFIEEKGIKIPDDINKSKILTDYAVDTRYPGIYEPVSEEEYK